MNRVKQFVAGAFVATALCFGVVPKPEIVHSIPTQVTALHMDSRVPLVIWHGQSIVPQADAQLASPGTTGLGTNVDAALLAGTVGVNWLSGASVVIALLLLGLAILGGIHKRARFSSPK